MGDPADIHHWFRLDERITTSGQPTADQLAALAGLGVKHVINLAPHSHDKALPDEAGTVERLGMSYLNLPVDFQMPSEAHFTAFCQAMTRYREAPLHVHCAANYRVAAFLYRYRREVLGADGLDARADLQRVW